MGRNQSEPRIVGRRFEKDGGGGQLLCSNGGAHWLHTPFPEKVAVAHRISRPAGPVARRDPGRLGCFPTASPRRRSPHSSAPARVAAKTVRQAPPSARMLQHEMRAASAPRPAPPFRRIDRRTSTSALCACVCVCVCVRVCGCVNCIVIMCVCVCVCAFAPGQAG